MADLDQFQWTHVGAFGGGLDYTKNPSALQPDQWSESTGFYAQNGYAETAPKLTLLVDMSGSLNPTDQIIGILQEPNRGDALVATVASGAFGSARLFRVTRAGVLTEITNLNGAHALLGNQSAVFQGAFINGAAVLNFGFVPSGSGIGLYSTSATFVGGGSTYQTMFPFFTYFHFLVGFAAHAIGAFGLTTWSGQVNDDTAAHQVTWAPANDQSFETPSIANDADDVILDDLNSGISLLATIGQSAVGIFTRDTVSVLAPTGSIPAFTRQQVLQGMGARQITNFVPNTSYRGQSFWGNTPAGLVVAMLDNLYQVGAGASVQAIGTPIFDAWNAAIVDTADPSVNFHQTFVWHRTRGLLLCPIAAPDPLEWYTFDPRTSAWSRQMQQQPATGTFARSAYIWSTNSGLMQQDYWCATQQQVYIEDTNHLPIVGGTVDTKDFCFGSPPGFAYIDRIKVDWECLSDQTNDSITILAAPRDALAPGLRGSSSLRIQPTFQTLGTLTGPQSELSIRLKTKWVRFRFQQTSGRARIRGFHIRWQAASDVKT